MIDFNKMTENYLERESKIKTIGRYYPSEIGSCMRKIWYSYKYPKKTDAELAKIFEMGNIVHDFVVEVLKSEKNKNVELISVEVPFKQQIEGFVISGRIDDLILIKDKNKKILVEVKSTKSLAYIKEAQQSHRMQLQLYMHATKVHSGIVLYVEKNTLQSSVFEVSYSEEEAQGIIKRFKNLHSSLKNDLLPIAEAKKLEGKEWQCRFCEYSEKCEKNAE